ncbi:aspartate aminotransferase family protein [uncultured Eudoraea sp.]|uniref:aspartate aminotransferase family protein n=1 Tax=uncultured Eudoraea sp. TaxID=1035614 RepID=UPI00261EADE7|nr:aspartate aminotransferase family protein [uncultured Eudoraea sp.]
MQEDFLRYQAQTTPYPLAMEVSHAQGSFIYDMKGNAHLDFVAGVSVCCLGHCHPKVVDAIIEQSRKYMHVMVYGEFIQRPALELTKMLASQLPDKLETTYLVNSGTEAMEGAIKLARRFTGRSKLIAAKNAYHGNTLGSLSLMNFEERKAPFRPLIPDIFFLEFNSDKEINKIDEDTAAVILETIQGGAGFIIPKNGYLRKVKDRCEKVGALLILDEIQPGFGRTGKLFAFEHYNCVPDILVMGKGMASGLPIGGFTASEKIMNSLSISPKLGHITTFGGNPVIAAAALATFKELTNGNLIPDTLEKEKQFRTRLKHPYIKEIRGKGLMLCLIMKNEDIANKLILACSKKNLILFWLLFEPKGVRITPPLTINPEEIEQGCDIIIQTLNGL